MAFFIAASQFTLCVFAADQDLKCPSTIPAESVRITNGEGGWISYVPYPLKLTAAGFMAGEPSTFTDLKPWGTKKIRGNDVEIWMFEGSYPQGIWLSCDYAGGIASLSRRIADTTSECSVMYERNKQGTSVVREIKCR
jgi:hypothetical protein